MTRIKLTESRDAKDARLMRAFRNAGDDFTKHLLLIQVQDTMDELPARLKAWAEGPEGLAKRIAHI